MATFQQLKDFYAKHEKWAPAFFFAAGLTFDFLTLGRIDDVWGLSQQALYLTVCGLILSLWSGGYAPRTEIGKKLWGLKEEALPFLLGSLLGVYTLFFFKAASLFSSALFLVLICIVLVANESRRLHRLGLMVPWGIFSLCLSCFYVCLVPILIGAIGAGPFLLSIAASALTAAPLLHFMRQGHIGPARSGPIAVFCAVQAAFLFLYFARLIPPVPLSIKSMGIYHDVMKADGKYQLKMARSPAKFWQMGDQDFKARAGDKIYFFARIFSPGDFTANLKVLWLHHQEGVGWQAWDAIPLPVTGWREEGFRAHAFKSNYAPGKWRVQVETEDGRELGRLYFTVSSDDSSEERSFTVLFE